MAQEEFIPVEHLPYAKDLVTVLPYAESDLREKVYTAIGAASACWENLSGAGIFESDRAKDIGDQLVKDILRLTAMGKPNLGCATNAELQNEIDTRAAFGHTEPSYKTVDG